MSARVLRGGFPFDPIWGKPARRASRGHSLQTQVRRQLRTHAPQHSARTLEVCARQWDEATAMVEGMLLERWHLREYQEGRLQEFLELLPVQHQNGDLGAEGTSISTPKHGMDMHASLGLKRSD